MSQDVLGVKDIADILGRSERWVYQKKTEIPGYFKLGGSVYFHARTFWEWIENNCTQPKAKPESPHGRHGL